MTCTARRRVGMLFAMLALLESSAAVSQPAMPAQPQAGSPRFVLDASLEAKGLGIAGPRFAVSATLRRERGTARQEGAGFALGATLSPESALCAPSGRLFFDGFE